MTMLAGCLYASAQTVYHEPYRLQVHYSPRAHWMNDPNGLIYFKGNYHLFYQYYPGSTVWGPMHWGHAISPDLVHWKELPIALYPDSAGLIFSGSAVADPSNTSGFGKDGKTPLVAIYTQQDTVGEKAGRLDFQNQSIAYSLDDARSWTKYRGNPVIKSPGLKDFRDPKVFWHPEQKKWILVLAAGDRVMIYSSKNLKSWDKESEFGATSGAHGGVWECPDLFPLEVDGKKIWLLIVSINPGGVQGGSGIQYFTGDFDGHQFTSMDTTTRWADYGPDHYAGVTFSNTGKEKIFLGWMSNWQYGKLVPTEKWRSAMTFPRKLGLKKIGQNYYTTQMPVDAIEKLVIRKVYNKHISSVKNYALSGPIRMEFEVSDLHAFSFIFSNAAGENIKTGYDEEKNSFFIDRTQGGVSDFYPGFATIHYGPRIAQSKNSKVTLLLDNASLELFADEGLTTITEIFFPGQPFNSLQQGANIKPVTDIRISQLKSIW